MGNVRCLTNKLEELETLVRIGKAASSAWPRRGWWTASWTLRPASPAFGQYVPTGTPEQAAKRMEGGWCCSSVTGGVIPITLPSKAATFTPVTSSPQSYPFSGPAPPASPPIVLHPSQVKRELDHLKPLEEERGADGPIIGLMVLGLCILRTTVCTSAEWGLWHNPEQHRGTTRDCPGPVLYTIYSADFKHNTSGCFLQKFSDDTVIIGLIKGGEDDEYRSLIRDFVDWSDNNHLYCNTIKTKEMVVDFRRRIQPAPAPTDIQDAEVEVVFSHRYLGVQLDNKLDWRIHVDTVCKKGQSRLYFLRRLRSFNIC